MRKTYLFVISVFILQVSVHSQAMIEINNSSLLARNDEVIAVPWNEVIAVYTAIDTSNFHVINGKTKKQVPYQLEYRGQSQVQNLLVQVTVGAKSKLLLRVQKGKPVSFVSKTYCRYVPERKDDFAWENDKIAFRMYGKALEKTPNEMAYGVDVWVKRTDRLILNERYKKGEYHVDHGDGLDYYHVGLTLGAGGIAPFIHDTIWFSKNYTQWKVLDNGPLRSTFQLEYDEWNAASQKVKAIKTISLDAGSQLNRIEVDYSFDQTSTLPVVAGIIKRKEPGEMLLNEKDGILAYWEPRHGADGTTGVGCILTTPVAQMMVKGGHLLAETLLIKGQPLIYYHGAAWDKAGEIGSSRKWFDYLLSCKQKLEQPLNVVVRKAPLK